MVGGGNLWDAGSGDAEHSLRVLPGFNGAVTGASEEPAAVEPEGFDDLEAVTSKALDDCLGIDAGRLAAHGSMRTNFELQWATVGENVQLGVCKRCLAAGDFGSEERFGDWLLFAAGVFQELFEDCGADGQCGAGCGLLLRGDAATKGQQQRCGDGGEH